MYRFQPSINPSQNWEVPRISGIYLGFTPLPKTTMTGWKSPPWMSRWSCDRFSGVDFNQIPSTRGRLASKIARFRGSLSARNAKCRVPGAPGAVSSQRGTCVPCYRSELDQQKKELLFSLFFFVTFYKWNESYLFDSWRKLKTLGFPWNMHFILFKRHLFLKNHLEKRNPWHPEIPMVKSIRGHCSPTLARGATWPDFFVASKCCLQVNNNQQ